MVISMAKSIANIVDDIRNATYGQEVRTAIADGIETCYSDVTTGKTLADSAASLAESAIVRANNASSEAETVVQEYNAQVREGNTLLSNMETLNNSCEGYATAAAESAAAASGYVSTVTTKASEASESATTASESATTASTKASEASESATTASASASTASTKASEASASAAAASASASTASTKASEASESATTASESASSAAEDASKIDSWISNAQALVSTAEENVQNVSALVSQAEDAAERAENAAGALEEAIESATAATNRANEAADDVEEATRTYTSLQSSLTVLRDNLNNTYIPTIESAITRSNSAINNATDLVTRGNTILVDAQNSIDSMGTCESEWLSRRTNIDAKLSLMQDATQSAKDAEQSIEDLSVTSESISSGVSSAEISNTGNHKNIHFKIRKGDPGESYIIKGSVYSSVEDLSSSVSNPKEGDLYNVGSEPPYNVFRWTGSEWEDQGKVGISIHKLTAEDIDDVFNNTEIDDADNKYMGTNSVIYYTNNKLLPLINQKVNVVSGKSLSTNDFTDQYKGQIDTNASAITSLSSNKVDKISGKGLSTNDFTNTYKNQITTNTTNIADLATNSLKKDYSTYSELVQGLLSEALFSVNYSSQVYKLSGSQLIADAITAGGILTSGLVATVNETKTYLGIEN